MTEPYISIYEKMQYKYTIYVDMDGVLTDFDKHYGETAGFDYHDKWKDYTHDPEFWRIIAETPHWWLTIPWTKDGKVLWNYVKKYDPILLTTPARKSTVPTCEEDKEKWVENNLGNYKIIFSDNKEDYAKNNTILIDDRESNVNAFSNKGGIGILHTSANNTIKKLKDLGL